VTCDNDIIGLLYDNIMTGVAGQTVQDHQSAESAGLYSRAIVPLVPLVPHTLHTQSSTQHSSDHSDHSVTQYRLLSSTNSSTKCYPLLPNVTLYYL
jgi:hypothetical protein